MHHVANGEILDDSGPLWFCLVLLVFCACFAACQALVPAVRPGARRPVPGAGSVLGYALAMAAVTFAVGVIAPGGGTILNVDVHDFPQYPLMFAAGVMAWRNEWPLRVSPRAGRLWLLGGLLVSLTLWVVLVTQGGALQGNLRAYGGGWHWQAAGMDLWRSFTCLSLSLGLVTLYRDRFNGQGPVARFLTRNAFGVYVFHAPVLIMVTRCLHDWPADTAAKFIVASVAAIAASFLLVGGVARRTPCCARSSEPVGAARRAILPIPCRAPGLAPGATTPGSAMPPTRPNPVLRHLLRAPASLYRWRCGWLLGHRSCADPHGSPHRSAPPTGWRSCNIAAAARTGCYERVGP